MGITSEKLKVRTELETPVEEPAELAMPNLVWPQFGFYHTVDSALAILSHANIRPDRITIRKAGPGWRKSGIVQQQPKAGSRLSPNSIVDLVVEGEGLFHFLPTGMRPGGKEGEIGVEELVSLFDDSVEKSACYVRQGGFYFDLRPENTAGCARWIRLFGIDPQDWPIDKWYRLALLLPALQYLAGTERGLRLALRSLLALEVEALQWRPTYTMLAPGEVSRLGQHSSQLGTNLIAGDMLENEAMLVITLGPVSLTVYRDQQTSNESHRLKQVLDLSLPLHTQYEVKWLVGNHHHAPRLGSEQQNSVLGINTHLGRETASTH